MLRLQDIPEDQILFYDIETDSQYAPYCNLKMIGAGWGFNGEPFLVETKREVDQFKAALLDPNILKVTFNGWSFDTPVLERHGYVTEPEGAHDVFLMYKAIAPTLASHSMKFLSWWYDGDPHFPEQELHRWCIVNQSDMWNAPKYILKPYCLHDIVQTRNLFRRAWEVIQRPLHWNAYSLDNSAGPAFGEMMIHGGMYLDQDRIVSEIATLQKQKLAWEGEAWDLSKGAVRNPNSGKQLGAYLANEEGFEFDLTNKGEFSVKREDLLDIIDIEDERNDRSRIARCAWEVRNINALLKYYNNYVAALSHDSESMRRRWIPRQYSLSNARTRRTTSNSRYKLNFQNASKEVKKVQVVPDGWVGVWIDSTQVENVVHIYESKDDVRRAEYEADPEWNEYVWLCNRILGGNRSKKELDSIISPQFPGWSIYKQYKTIKLALNFGMGLDTFCKKSGIDPRVGRQSFNDVHSACPAIKNLQDRVERDLRKYGYVQDVFGHIYQGSPRKAYKVVAYLVQGTGTGSLPKAQLAANRNTIREAGGYEVAVLAGTTHDENELRLSLRRDPEENFATLQKLMFNMTDRFSAKFDNIPLRAKLYLSRKDAYDADKYGQVDLTRDRDKILSILDGNN